MKRYFYTDPLAAAWMAKHFGMRFGYGDSLRSALEVAGADCSSIPFYLHPDSLHLLEPQDGDGVEFDRWYWERQRNPGARSHPPQAHFGKVRIDKAWKSITSLGITWDTAQPHESFSLQVRIIQRNGVPFMWPEVEL